MKISRKPLQNGRLACRRLCAVAAAPTADAMRKQMLEGLRLTQTVELRLDWLANREELEQFLGWLETHRPRGATLVATCRRRNAGGQFDASVGEQLVYLGKAVKAGCDWYDLEVESVELCPPELLDVLLGPAKRLVSAHFFLRFPKDLDRAARRLEASRPAAIQIAVHCSSVGDAVRLVKFGIGRKNAIGLPMGHLAMPVRLLALRDRHGFSYAAVDNNAVPSQPSLGHSVGMYRADKLDSATSPYGVISDVVNYCLSPAIHNEAFQARRRNAIYVPFWVRDLKDFVSVIPALGMKGFSVAPPHKERIVRFLHDCDPLAEKIGAVNTVTVRKGKLHGCNTDYVGVLRSIGQRMPVRGSRILIVGAAGIARSVAFALAEAGAFVCACAHRPQEAHELARAVNGQVIIRSRLRSEFFDAIINTTPVGMHPELERSPIEAEELNCRLVFDTIYRPRKTKLLALAEQRGIETVTGVDLFVAQGAAQWEIWTGERAPVEAMRRAAIRVLEAEEKKKMRNSERPIKTQ